MTRLFLAADWISAKRFRDSVTTRYFCDECAIKRKQTVRLKHVLFVAVFIISLAGWAKADVDIAYSGKLTQLPASALFSFTPRNSALTFPPDRNFFRLWGADISGAKLPEDILDIEYRCRHVGKVSARGFGEVYIVDCWSAGVDLAGLLIRQGLALEICSETGNKYGTCSKRKDAK